MRTPRTRTTSTRALQMNLQEAATLEAGGTKIVVRNRRIPHAKILQALQRSGENAGNIVDIYRLQVLPIKTRTIHLLGKKAPAKIITTLLGYEVQASYKRINCPDMVTARYLKLFTEIGCHSIRLPYDPTVTARLIPELEASLQQLDLGVRSLFPDSVALQAYVLRRTYSLLRSRLRSS